MAPLGKSKDSGGRKGSKDRDGDEVSSLNLWVSSLSSDTVDSDLIKVFKDYGAMDALTSYVPRTYAFVFFRTTEEAKKAKDELQGKVIKGIPIRIEFARTAKPGKHLWIGGLSPSITKKQLEDELLQYGKLEDFKFMRDRNSALVGYYTLNDAINAHKNINGKSLAGQVVRADFQKPQYPRRDLLNYQNSRGQRSMAPQDAWTAPFEMRSFHDLSDQGSRRHLQHGGRRDGPSNTLWIGFPPSVHMDEQMLHNAMILFGEIEKIKCFPSRNYAFVDFRSIDEARRAKEGLQGRLFGDPRIQIMFSNSETGPGRDNAPILPGYGGPRQDVFNEAPFAPLEFLGQGPPMAPNSFPGHFPRKGSEMNMSMRSNGAQGFDPRQENTDFHDFDHSIPPYHVNNQNAPSWRHQSPAPGLRTSLLGMRPPSSMQGQWDDEFDMREAKRSRVDESPVNEARFRGRGVGGQVMADEFTPPHPERAFPAQNHGSVIRGNSHSHESSDIDIYWRGVISKGGLFVCHARCVPIGKGLESPLPEAVNCFARTDLDMLTKYCREAIGFDIVFFVPDSEEDFASYTEFLGYLGLKNRVGVAKCGDGTTLFLVPPSDFLTKVLKVSGPERLYGVLLKFPQQSNLEEQQSQAPPHYSEQQQRLDLQNGYVPHEEPALRADNSNALHENSMSHAGLGVPQASEPSRVPPATSDFVSNPGATANVGLSLTPELIAALTSVLPANNQLPITGSNNMPSSSSGTSFPSNLNNIPSASAQGWILGGQSTLSASELEPTTNVQQHLQQFSGYSMLAPSVSQNLYVSNLPNVPDNSVQPELGGGHARNFASNVQQISTTPTRHLDNYALTQGQSFVHQTNQQYQPEYSFSSYNAHQLPQASDSMAMLNKPVQQQQVPAYLSFQGQNTNMMQNQMNSGTEFSAQAPQQQQQQQMVPNVSAADTSQKDAEKNLRYQQTLQFAATLIQKIQQQSQGGGHAAGGSGDQL